MSTHYPIEPGAKERGGTSEEAAQAIGGRKSAVLRELAFRVLEKFGPMTADEVAARCAMSVLSIRPRISELGDMGRIRKTNERRRNASGQSAAVWEAVRG